MPDEPTTACLCRSAADHEEPVYDPGCNCLCAGGGGCEESPAYTDLEWIGSTQSDGAHGYWIHDQFCTACTVLHEEQEAAFKAEFPEPSTPKGQMIRRVLSAWLVRQVRHQTDRKEKIRVIKSHLNYSGQFGRDAKLECDVKGVTWSHPPTGASGFIPYAEVLDAIDNGIPDQATLETYVEVAPAELPQSEPLAVDAPAPKAKPVAAGQLSMDSEQPVQLGLFS